MKYFHHIFVFLKQNFLFLFIITIRSSLSAKSNIQDSHKHILFPAFSCAWVTIYYFFACLNFFLLITGHFRGLQGGTSGKEPACQCRKHKRRGFDPWVGKIWRSTWQPTPVFLPREFHGQGSLVGYSP